MSGVATSTKLPVLNATWKAEVDDHIIALAWSPTGTKLAAATVSGPIHIFSSDGAAHLTLPGHALGTMTIAWSSDGQHFASGGQDGKIHLWEITAREPQATIEAGPAGSRPWVEELAWNPMGGGKSTPHLLASAAGRKLRLWNAAGELQREFEDHPSTIASIAWKPGTQFLTTAAYSQLAIYTPGGEKAHRRFEWKGSILKIAWSPNGKFVATGDQDSTVHFWYDKTGKDLQMWGYPTKVRELSWDATSRYLATGGGADVTVWDCIKSPAGSTPISLKAHEAFLTDLAFQHRGPLLASGAQDGRVMLWQPGKDRKGHAGIGINSPVAKIAWAPDDRTLAVGTEAGGIIAFATP